MAASSRASIGREQMLGLCVADPRSVRRMHFAFLDESKHADAFCVTALVVPSAEVSPLTADLDAVVEYAQETYGRVHDGAELHGYSLAGGTDYWAPLSDVAARVDIYERAMSAIAGHDVRVCIRGAYLDEQKRRYGRDTDPYGTVLPWTLERVQDVAAFRKDEALVIADEVVAVARHRRAYREYQRHGTWGWRAQNLDRLVDTLHFAPSHASRGLQAADLVSYAYTQRRKTFRNPRAQAAWERIWSSLGDRLWEVSIWPA